ncbi:MAG: histone deacetylase [Acidobacteriota bacterium]
MSEPARARRRIVGPIFRASRRLRRRVLGSSVQVVFDRRYTGAFPGVPIDPLRAEHILAFLAHEGLVLRRSVHSPEAASLRALSGVHTAEYLDAVHEPSTMSSILGLDVTPAQVDRLLDEQRLQTGGTVRAVELARRGRPAVNLGGGFHHAYRDHGSGFCLFNDLALAVESRRRRGYGGRVLIVDLDLHDGDGTRDFFRRDRSVHTFSMHAAHWGEVEAEESTSLELGGAVADREYLKTLEAELPKVFERFRPDLVVYVAGVDPAAGDALGGDWLLTPRGLLERDRRVARWTARAGAALCVVLAGGYGPDAWRYSARFLAWLECGRALEPPPTELMTLWRYRYIARLFSSAELSGGSDDEFGITEADLALPGWSGLGETRFLGFYTKHAIELVFERTGMFDRFRDLGFASPCLEMQLDKPAGHALSVYGDPGHSELLAEVRLRRERRVIQGAVLLSVEWLLLQNPRLAFTDARPKLPGQEHPGLGMLQDVVSLLILVCERLHLDGLTFVPSQFHIAAFGGSYMRFADPEIQALFDALSELFRELPLARATRAVAEGRVRDAESGEEVRWRPAPMVMALSDSLTGRLEQERAEGGGGELGVRPLRLEPAVAGDD